MSLLLALLAATHAAPPAAPAPEAKKICRSDPETGSRVAVRRRCMTAAQWKAEEEENRAFYQWQREYSRTPN